MAQLNLHPLREPCKRCHSTNGFITTTNGQDVVRCFTCQYFQYNAPRVETGREIRSISTVHEGIRPSVRARVLERASGHCELCGRHCELQVSHLLSVKDGLAFGLTETLLNHDENLAALCTECNGGMSSMSFSPRLYIALLKQRVERAHDKPLD